MNKRVNEGGIWAKCIYGEFFYDVPLIVWDVASPILALITLKGFDAGDTCSPTMRYITPDEFEGLVRNIDVGETYRRDRIRGPRTRRDRTPKAGT